MATLKRSGGFVAMYWQGKVPDPRDEEFCETLANQRFRTIENAASEEVSVGWVTPALPTGDEFTPEDIDGGVATWLRMRIDKKTLPRKWLQIHLESEERARGKKLPPRERRELKEDIGERLLPRVLPTINLVDALMFHDRKTILLFATSNAVVEAFGKLFFETFALPLDRASPYQCGTRVGVDRDLLADFDRLTPVRWPDATRPGDVPTAPPALPKPIAALADDPVVDDPAADDPAAGDPAEGTVPEASDADAEAAAEVEAVAAPEAAAGGEATGDNDVPWDEEDAQ